MSVDETLMCSFQILKPADKKAQNQRPKTPKVWLFLDSLLYSCAKIYSSLIDETYLDEIKPGSLNWRWSYQDSLLEKLFVA